MSKVSRKCRRRQPSPAVNPLPLERAPITRLDLLTGFAVAGLFAGKRWDYPPSTDEQAEFADAALNIAKRLSEWMEGAG
ncbi:MAG TPA: hypothetical protein VMP01_10315 [Pirellulaceae bacterium]|nr:hypothetical protein [Pirellulaceae bacterium]